MTDQTPQITADIPEVAAFLATLPADPERDRLTADYRQETDRLAELRHRQQALDGRLNEIAATLPDASGKAREALIAERGTVTMERANMPLDLAVAARRTADAHVAWARRLHREAAAEFTAANERIAAYASERRRLHDRLTRHTESTGSQKENADAIARWRARLEEIAAELAPVYRRRDDALQVAGIIESRIRHVFGDTVQGGNVAEHQIVQFVERTRRAVA